MVEQVVGLEFIVTGERQATTALKDFAKAGSGLGTSLLELGRKISSIEGEYLKINQLNKQGVVVDNARRTAIAKLAAQLSALTGVTETQAASALRASQKTRDKAEADRKAAQAAEQLASAQRNLEGSILRQAQAVNQALSRMEELNRLKASGALGSRNMVQAELEVARALARTNGYLKANGALNTQKALAELRAAQATREAAATDAAAAATKTRLTQSYNQLLASINPVIAAQQRTKQTVDMLRAAVAAGAITTTQAAQALNQYRNALRNMGAANQQVALGMNLTGVMTQQAGYQIGDFIVQVQGGTNAFVAFGQQATQMAGMLTLLGGRYILIGSALGITIPLLTALGAGLVRAKVEADAVYNKFGFLEGSVRGLASAFSEAGGVILNVLMTIVRHLDIFVSILGVAAIAAIVKFVAATSAMGTIVTGIGLMFTGMAGAQLVAASATATLTAAMSRMMVVISAHPIIAAMTAALAVAVFVLYRARDASGAFRSNVEGLSDALKELRDNAKEAGLEAARIQLGADTDAQAIALQRVIELNAKIAEQARIIRENGNDKQLAKDRINALIAERDEIENLIEADRLRVRNMEKAAAQSSLDAIIGSYDEQYALQVKINDAQEKLNDAVRLGLIDHETMVKIMDEYKASLSDTADAAKDFLEHQKGINDLLEAGRKAESDRNRAYFSMMREKRNEMAMQAVINQYGQDSVQAAIERARQEAIAARLTAEQRDNFIAAAIEAYNLADATEDVAESTSNIAYEMSMAANEALRFVSNLESGGGVNAARARIAGLRAELGARQGGAGDVEAAAARAEAEVRARPEFQLALTGPEGLRQETLAGLNREVEAARLNAEAGMISSEISGLGRTPDTPSGGASNVVDINAILDSRRQQIEQERVLLGLSGQQREAQTIYFDLLKQNEDAVNRLTDTELMAAANVEAAAREKNRVIEEGLKRQQDISNLLESSMEKAFMSIIDGTMSVKDAFKAMASDIIKELYRIFVVKQITGMIANAIFPGSGALVTNANGNAFSNGNVVPFANGGVVGSPTTFPMAGGKTGLMGEAGPEAIMPLKRGRDGKLGVAADGGGAVTVNNYFTVQANGDDSVKRIVRQQIPQIAEATKAAVVDAKRRGGSYGRAFG